MSLAIEAYLRHEKHPKSAEPEASGRWLVVVLVAFLNLAAIAVLEHLGFCLTVLIFMLILFRWIGRHSWQTSIGTALGLTVIYYIAFAYLLQIPLPAGVLQ